MYDWPGLWPLRLVRDSGAVGGTGVGLSRVAVVVAMVRACMAVSAVCLASSATIWAMVWSVRAVVAASVRAIESSRAWDAISDVSVSMSDLTIAI